MTPRTSAEGGAASRTRFEKLRGFFFNPCSPVPLAALRIGVAAVLIVQIVWVTPYAGDLFSPGGLVQRSVLERFLSPGVLSLGSVLDAAAFVGLNERTALAAFTTVFVVAVMGMGVGLFTQACTFVVWLQLTILMQSGHFSGYGVDMFLHICLFYLLWAPGGRALSLDVTWRGLSPAHSIQARLMLRVLQIHLCIAYLAAGVKKAVGIQWWNGEAIWRAVMLPEYRQFDFSWLGHWPWVAVAAGILTLIVEAGYPLFIWPKASRPLWVVATVGLHLGIGLFMGMWVFALTMCLLTICAFGLEPFCSDPRRVVGVG